MVSFQLHIPVMVIALLVASVPSTSLSALAEDPPATNAEIDGAVQFELEEVWIQIPTDIWGYVKDDQPEEFQGLYNLSCWVNLGPTLRITASDPIQEGVGADGEKDPFHKLRQLLQAYRNGDIEQTMALYDARSRATFRQRLADPSFRATWLDYVGSMRAMEPLIMWAEGEQIHCLMKIDRWDKTSGTSERTDYAMIFTSDFDLAIGSMTSVMVGNLRLFFNDDDRRAEDLIVNLNYARKHSTGE